MPDVKMTLKGMENAEKQMARIKKGLAEMAGHTARVGSPLPYAYGIHEGRHKRGRLARRAGGAKYIESAVQDVLSNADRDLSEGLSKVTAPGVWVVRRIALWARRLARQNAKGLSGGGKKSHGYRLWRSIRHEVS